jgi:hypothetical protein
MEESNDVVVTKQLKMKAEPFLDQRPEDQPKKVKILPDEDVRTEAARVYQEYRAVMRRLGQ